MPRLGDAANRPDEDFIVVPAAPKMQAESALLSSNTLVAWFEDGRKDVPCNEVVVAFATTFGCRKEDVSVVRHLSEQFFVKFILGIVKDGEDFTNKALDAFAERCKEQLPQEVLPVMRELFNLDDTQTTRVEDALIEHGGVGGMDVERMEDAIAVIQGSI
ncbi:Disease resistance protein RPM1 [Hordeum vulgare]|nr:Disease resistance protein RPM1 [Hordeum vulgare]